MTGTLGRRFFWYLLVGLCFGLTAWLSQYYAWEWDATQGHHHSLSPASQMILGRLSGPVKITCFVTTSRDSHRLVRAFIGRYQRHYPGITLELVDPQREPGRARERGVSRMGETLVAYQDRQEHLAELREETLSAALQRLLMTEPRTLLTLTGHGERALNGIANHDLGDFGQALTQRGFKILALSLAEVPQIPENIDLLILPSPQTRWLTGELRQLLHYVERGGNLLWLADPGDLQPLQTLAEVLGIGFRPGVVVDPNGRDLGLEDPTIAVVADYPDHPAIRGLKALTLFPGSVAVEPLSPDWQAEPLLRSMTRTWNETGPIQGEVRRQPHQGETAGPLTLGLALTRTLDGKEQRITVIGDSDFLSNRYLANGGNLPLGLSLVRWLAAEDALVPLPLAPRPDQELVLTAPAQAFLGLGLLLGAPLLLLGIGLWVTLRRRRG
ncbi:MAG: GldG family protein [Pseudomonadota bacterium]